VIIPAAIRKRAGFEPGTKLLEVRFDNFSVQLVRVVPGPKIVRSGNRLVARPTVSPEERPEIDVAALIEEERDRWP